MKYLQMESVTALKLNGAIVRVWRAEVLGSVPDPVDTALSVQKLYFGESNSPALENAAGRQLLALRIIQAVPRVVRVEITSGNGDGILYYTQGVARAAQNTDHDPSR